MMILSLKSQNGPMLLSLRLQLLSSGMTSELISQIPEKVVKKNVGALFEILVAYPLKYCVHRNDSRGLKVMELGLVVREVGKQLGYERPQRLLYSIGRS
jgi:hypothetical protein